MDDTDEIPGVNNEPVNEEGDANNEEGDANNANNKTERTAGRMNLRNQNRREYNVFNLTEEAENEGVLLFQMDPDTFDTVEAEFDVLDAEYLFLTERLTPTSSSTLRLLLEHMSLMVFVLPSSLPTINLNRCVETLQTYMPNSISLCAMNMSLKSKGTTALSKSESVATTTYFHTTIFRPSLSSRWYTMPCSGVTCSP